MKTTNFFRLTTILISIILSVNLINLHAAEGDFNAWELKAGSSGMSCTDMNFTEKDITVELWLNIEEANFTPGVTIASTRHNGSHGFSLDVSNDGRLRGFFRNDNGDQLDGRTDYIFPFFFAKEDIVDKWVHIAIVFSSTSNIARSYLNGQIYQDIVKSTEPYQPYNIGWIGNIKADGNNVGGLRVGYWYEDKAKLHGKIAELRIWNVGRTDEEIKANYNKPLAGNQTGLHMHYNFANLSQAMANTGSRGGIAYLLPGDTWENVHSHEILSQKPHNLTITNDQLTWQSQGQSWDVEVRSKSDNSLIKSETTTKKTFNLAGITQPYTTYVRTLNNGFYSGWSSNLIKVGCVGDSNTYGAEATDRSKYAWPVQIRAMLGDQYETQNFGVNGALMMDHLNDAWKNKTAYTQNKSYDPEIIIIALGTNDSKDNYWDAEKFKTSYINLINEFKTYPANPQIYMAIPIKAYSNSWQINDATIRQNIIPLMKEISKELAMPLIDLYTVTNDIANLMASDGIHPKDEGLRIIARKIADIMLTEKPRITVDGTEPTQKYAAYTWYKDNMIIENANDATHTATQTGTYKAAVKLTEDNNDILLSETIEVTEPGTPLTIQGNPPSALPRIQSGTPGIITHPDYIQIKNAEGAQMTIYTLSGQILTTHNISQDNQILPTTSWTKGIYLCKFDKNNKTHITKIIR